MGAGVVNEVRVPESFTRLGDAVKQRDGWQVGLTVGETLHKAKGANEWRDLDLLTVRDKKGVRRLSEGIHGDLEAASARALRRLDRIPA